MRYETAEGQDIEVAVVTRGFARPWSLAFVADDTILVTERAGTVRAIRGGKLDAEPVAGVPRFAPKGWPGSWTSRCTRSSRRNGYVYLSYSKPISADDTASRDRARPLGRARAARHARHVRRRAETTGGARLAFGGDGML